MSTATLDNALVERFLAYAKHDTQSSRESKTAPSTEKQLRLAELLVEELQTLGAVNARIGMGGVVYAEIPATPGCEEAPAVGFIAHMDTSPDASGEGVSPQILRFTGEDVLLNAEKNIVFPVESFPEIKKYAGEDVIFTDGTTLLGADDKAGIAAIMGMVHYVSEHPEMPHAKLCIGFTPDEEVSRGTENFDIPVFGAKYAYTFDGGEVGQLESENFNAGTAWVTVKGVGVHPGSAKGKMVNAIRYLAKFLEMLPPEMSPECTEGHEGFLHPNNITGNVVSATARLLIRDHDRKLYDAKKELLAELVATMNERYPEAPCSLEIKDFYENMRDYIDRAPYVLDIARAACRAVGLEPVEKPIRGGTDGARLSVRGLPCPNVFTGGMNYHGIYECLPVKSLLKARDVAVELARGSASVRL